jgi:hypothetical protein
MPTHFLLDFEDFCDFLKPFRLSLSLLQVPREGGPKLGSFEPFAIFGIALVSCFSTE